MNTRSQYLTKASRCFVVLACLLLVGCLTPVDMSKVELGMTKEEVIGVLGTPYDYKAKGNTIYLMFKPKLALAPSEVRNHARFVRLVDGKVESFGAVGDFDSTKDPTLNLNIKNR